MQVDKLKPQAESEGHNVSQSDEEVLPFGSAGHVHEFEIFVRCLFERWRVILINEKKRAAWGTSDAKFMPNV